MCAGVLRMHSGLYRCPDNIKNFKIRVKLRKLHSSTANSGNIDLNITEKETKVITWQNKVFSRSEAEFYAKKNNCFTDLEIQYHEIISNRPELENYGKIFTYTQEDNYFPNDELVTTGTNKSMPTLQKRILNLTISNRNAPGYEFKQSLNNCISNPFVSNNYETMYVMADLGDSNEHILCKIKYDEDNKLLWVYPDFSVHKLETDVGGKQFFEYSIENISEQKSTEVTEQENEILREINSRKNDLKMQILGRGFEIPTKNIKYYLFFELLTAKNFENNIYIQYNIDLPKNWTTSDDSSLFGTTQTCMTKGRANWAYFGFYFDVCLEFEPPANFEGEVSSPVIYFQVISRDNWDRYRLEGLGYQNIPVFLPGLHEFKIECFRICPSNSTGFLRRFFIGDYFNIDDVTWIGVPKDHKGSILNKFGVPTIGTGSLVFRLNVLKQSAKTSDGFENAAGVSQGHSLMHSVGEVIIAFRRARDKMIQARRNILE